MNNSNTDIEPKYVLLVRHASRDRKWYLSEDKHEIANKSVSFKKDLDPKKEGYPVTQNLAAHLVHVCKDDFPEIKHAVVIRHSKHKIAEQTAEIFTKVFDKHRLKYDWHPSENSWDCLTPEKADPKKVVEWIKSNCSSNVFMLVGHQPTLTDIAMMLLNGQLPTNSLPLGSSEIACIRTGKEPRLLWLVTEKPDTLLAELKDKIKSKYDVAKFFLGAFIVSTGIILNANLWETNQPINTILAYLAVLVAAASLILTAATLFSYDELLMPVTFWSTRSREKKNIDDKWSGWNVKRPPSQAHVVLYYEMVHVWQVFFIPALATAFISIGLAIGAIAYNGPTILPEEWVSTEKDWFWIVGFGIASLIMFFGLKIFYEQNRPNLGIDD